MADKIIKLRLDVTKMNKDWFFKGEKGTYVDCTLLYNEVPNEFKSNGMIVQDVPKVIYEKEKTLPKDQQTKGAILGNALDWATQKGTANTESIPGNPTGGANSTPTPPPQEDNLPF